MTDSNRHIPLNQVAYISQHEAQKWTHNPEGKLLLISLRASKREDL